MEFVTAYCDGSILESYESLQEALNDLRKHWNEEPIGPQTFVLTNDTDMLATMVRLADPELCLTVYPDGKTETHRCHYVLDANGRYLKTEISPA